MIISLIICWPYNPVREKSSPVYDNMVVFGDSLSDSADFYQGNEKGNNYWVKPADILLPKGAPITSMISMQKPLRKTWVNYFLDTGQIIKSKGLYNIHDLQPNTAYRHNSSFAVASAETGDYYTSDTNWARINDNKCPEGVGDYGAYNCVPGVLKQVHLYLKNVNHHPNPNTLFILWAGGNDFYQNIVRLLTRNGQPLAHPIENIVKSVRLLIKSGVPAQHIYVLNLPNFSMVPAVQGLLSKHIQNQKVFDASLSIISFISDIYNLSLKTNLVLHTYGKFSPAHVFPVDKLFLSVYFNKDNIKKTLGLDKASNITCAQAQALPVCQGYLFYNSMHPTTAVHQYLAKVLQDYISQHP